MKKIILPIVAMLFVFTIDAQTDENFTKFYFGLNTGYTMPVANSTVGSPRSEVGMSILNFNLDEGTYSEENPFGSRGAGYTVSANFGYLFTENFGVEMEFSFLRSSRILDASRNETNTSGNNYFAEQHSYTNMFRAAPMLVVQGNPNKKFTPYAKFGILLPLMGKTVVEVDIHDEIGELASNLLPVLNEDLYNELVAIGLADAPIPSESYIKAKTSGSFSVGFASRIGCNYNINDKWSINAELQMNMLTIKAHETEFVDFESVVDENIIAFSESILGHEVQGTYTMDDIPEILKLTVYQDEITETSNTTYDPARKDEAFDQLTFRDSYNSFGLTVGFKYNF